ncbi:MAG: glutamate formimidoyltransferase [Chloroflexi bacterium]|jgi:glutamate formiminotransferase/formiminotetrahydrofolate cyclodeaminase|nr:glutamate formimidoyltransferase [Chloroflexota bacterium]
MRLVECIPNFSEARRPEVIDEIVAAITSVPGIHLLDRSSDLDHNRTVITFVGPPQEVEEAAFRAIRTAAQRIDLNQHRGEHPRIGATDVCPFVPLEGVSMEECVAMARRLGERVGRELGIPVYLYEYAATRPDRVNLENIRRGQYEGLKEEIATNPERFPDFGPAQLGPAGATVIGARDPLIAFNVYLTTDDVEIARRIASAIRHSSGGLRYVKALGLLVEGRAQVSMNLTNYLKTPLARVVEMIRREAARYGVAIHHSELIGLIPQRALIDAAVWYLQLDAFQPDQVLENRLYSLLSSSSQPAWTSFLDSLAAPTPTPGGGSAAAAAAAMGAALVAMVAGLTLGKKKYAAVEEEMRSIQQEARELQQTLSQAVQEDAQAFEAILAAMRLPKETPAEAAARQQAMENATLQATRVPLETARRALRVMELARIAVEKGNLNAITDAATGFQLAQAALRAAACNVRVNLAALPEHPETASLLAALSEVETQAENLSQVLTDLLKQRANL